MHPIAVRTMKFDVPSAEEFHPLCVAGNSALSYTHLTTGLYVAYLEPFFVKSLRRVMDQIRDEALREDVERFSRQEAQHYQRHIDFNKRSTEAYSLDSTQEPSCFPLTQEGPTKSCPVTR